MIDGGMAPTPLSHWIGFHLALLLLLGAELVFSRVGLRSCVGELRSRRQRRNAIAATLMWTLAALAFAGFLLHVMGGNSSTQFLAGYAIEESLSIDNLFVFLLLFRVFDIPETYQPRVLFWGVLGAIVLRGIFIAAGIGLLEHFAWVNYGFAVILLVASVRLVWPSKDHAEETAPPRRPRWIKWISRIHPVSIRHDVFFVRETRPGSDKPRRVATMLFLSLIAIETADIVFAIDSIPAVLSITRNPFLAYTSNVLAVMGLRSLYFLLAHMFKKLRFLHVGLAAVLFFASVKMLLGRWYQVGPLASLGVIVGILGATIAASLLPPRARA